MPGMEYAGYAIVIVLIVYFVFVPILRFVFTILGQIFLAIVKLLARLVICGFYGAFFGGVIGCVLAIWLPNHQAFKIACVISFLITVYNILGDLITPCYSCKYCYIWENNGEDCYTCHGKQTTDVKHCGFCCQYKKGSFSRE